MICYNYLILRCSRASTNLCVHILVEHVGVHILTYLSALAFQFIWMKMFHNVAILKICFVDIVFSYMNIVKSDHAVDSGLSYYSHTLILTEVDTILLIHCDNLNMLQEWLLC